MEHCRHPAWFLISSQQPYKSLHSGLTLGQRPLVLACNAAPSANAGADCSQEHLPETLRGRQPAEQRMLLQLAHGSHVWAVYD